MKKVLPFILIIAIAVSLCACGKVDDTMGLINAIGEVTLQSGDAINAAEAAYGALKEHQQGKIENYAVLTDARAVYDRITNVATLIDAIGEVTLESETAIVTAEEAYAALSAAEQAKIDNYDLLPAARTAFEDAKFEAFKDSLAGKWISDFDGDFPIELTRYTAEANAAWDGEWTYGSSVDQYTGQWRVDRDTNALVMFVFDCEVECKFVEEDGFLKFVTGSGWINVDSTCYVRSNEYQEAFDAKFLAVELTGENYTEYLEGPIHAGYVLDENGNPDKNTPAYVLRSKLYDQGYVYVGTSRDFVIDVIREEVHNGKVSEDSNPVKWHLFEPQRGFVLREGWTQFPIRLGDQTTGTAYFVKAEDVAENYCDSENHCTYLRMTNGAVYLTGHFGEFDFEYEDYLR